MSSKQAQVERSMVEQLICSAGARAPGGAQAVEAVDYDWRTPCRFVPSELSKLNEFAANVAERISEGLGGLLRLELKVAAAALKQHYAADVGEALSESADHRAALAVEGGRDCGLICLPASNAQSWVGRLLGIAAEPADGDRELSAVERGLLTDLVAAVAEALSAASKQIGGPGFKHVEAGPDSSVGPGGGEFSEYGELTFRPEGSQNDRLLSVFISADVLAGVCGERAGGPAQQGPEQVRKALVAHLENTPVEATVRLGRTELPVRDILSLAAGDVLVMQQRPDDPVDVLVGGKVVLSGFPARHSGKYAVKIAAAGQSGRG